MTNNTESTAIVIDVACTFEDGPAAYDTARMEKIKKYNCLKKSLASKFKEVSVEVIIVGALGSWDPKNDRICHRLCSKKYTKLMKNLIVSDTLRASRDIYITHLNRKKSSIPAPEVSPIFHSYRGFIL